MTDRTNRTETGQSDVIEERFWPRWAEAVLVQIEKGASVELAAARAGVGRRTVYDLIDRSEIFEMAWKDSRQVGAIARAMSRYRDRRRG